MAVSLALNWILFLGLFPIAFYWLRRAWRILIKRDFSEVALKYGEAPPNAARFAPYDGVLHLLPLCPSPSPYFTSSAMCLFAHAKSHYALPHDSTRQVW